MERGVIVAESDLSRVEASDVLMFGTHEVALRLADARTRYVSRARRGATIVGQGD
jgi:hypothetical protein